MEDMVEDFFQELDRRPLKEVQQLAESACVEM